MRDLSSFQILIKMGASQSSYEDDNTEYDVEVEEDEEMPVKVGVCALVLISRFLRNY